MNYSYASGSVKALETKVLDRNKLFVLAKYDKSEHVKVLLSMNYGEKGETVEDLIVSEMNKVKGVIDSLSPKKKITDLFYLLDDAQNIKILYKIKFFNVTNIEINDDLFGDGSLNCESLKKAIIDDDKSELSDQEKELITILNKKLEKVSTPKELSFIIDKEMYHYALNTKNSVMKKYLLAKIDCTNIISLIRCHNLKWTYEEYESILLDGGNISKNVLKSIYDLDDLSICKSLEGYYEENISKILRKCLEVNSFEALEIEFERFILDILSAEKENPFDVGPMIYYYLLKKAEAQNIRLLYSKAKIEIKELL